MTAAKPVRVNARLTPAVAKKAAYLERRLKLSTTDLVQQAIEHLYDAVQEEHSRAEEILARAGFIGCAEGARDLSVTYKAELTRSLERKLSLR